jgi:hypothetical protein
MNVPNSSFQKRFFSRVAAKWASLLLLSAITALLYNYFFLTRAYVQLEMEVEHSTFVKMLWADKTETEYSWKKKVKVKVRPHKKHYGFFIGDLRKIYSIRFYPCTKNVGEIIIKKITIKQPGMKIQEFSSPDDFNKFIPGWGIETTRFEADKGWIVVPAGKYPHFHLIVDHPPRSINVPVELGRFLGILFVLYLIFSALEPLVEEHRYVCVMALVVVVLATVMAVTSLDNHHPDERVHVQAADYYTTHWMIPAVDSSEIADTYSAYGFSRLNSKEICYIITAKFSKFLNDFNLHSFQRYRFLNVLLLGILVLMAFKELTARLLMIPLLMTPQAWYIFSYYNSDAFTMFMNFQAGYQVVYKKSLFNRFLQGKVGTVQAVIILGVLTGILLLLKKNNYFYLLFLVGYMLLSCLLKKTGYTKNCAKKLLLIVCIGLILAGIRYGVDVKVNGFNKREQTIAMSKKRAKKEYNLTTPLEDRSPFIRMKTRGVTFDEFINKYNWPGKISRSFFGVYGYLTVHGSTAYYTWMRYTGALFVLFISCCIIVRGSWWENGLLLQALICSAGLICAAGYFAWFRDFQAQGRYLLPILSILGIVIAQTERFLQPLLFRAFVVLMFVMSVNNFIFVGLKNIAQHGWG